jgi:hypothetical protein
MQTSPDRNASGNGREDVYSPSDTVVPSKSGTPVKSNDPPAAPAKSPETESPSEAGGRVFKFDFERDPFTFKGKYNVVPGGDNYGFDATGKFGKLKDTTGELNFKRDEAKDTAEIKTDWKFGDRYTFKGNYNVVPGGDNYGFDATGKFGKQKDIAGEISFKRDGGKDSAEVKAGLNIRERYTLDANFNLVPGGNNYGFNAAAKLGPEQNTKAEVGFKRDELAKSTSGEFSLATGNGLTAEGKVAKKDGAFTWSAATLIPLEGTGNKLGLGIERNEAQRFTKFNGSVLFDEGTSKFGVNSQFGKTESTGIEFSRKTKDYTVSGNLEIGNATGPYKLQKAGLGISTPETSRHRLNFSADYGLQTKEFSAKLTYTFTFGGGSKSRSSRDSDDRFAPPLPGRESSTPVVSLTEKRLHDQAVAGVEKLNAAGEKLPVKETAANLVALAKANSFENIAAIELGSKTAGGRQNLFVFDGDPHRYSTRQAFIDRDQATAPNVGVAHPSPMTPTRKQETPSAESALPTQEFKPLRM